MEKYIPSLYNILSILLLSFLISCHNENPVKSNDDIIRFGVKLTTNEIPILEGVEQIKVGDRPWFYTVREEEQERFYVILFTYSWELTQNDYVYVDVIVAESKDLINEYFEEKRKLSNCPPDLQPPPDKPTIAGEISYSQGREFIRDNIYIKIKADGSFIEKREEIAKQIDEIILNSPTADSANDVKPVINKFEILENPVDYNSVTKLIIEVNDPQNSEIFYDWRWSPASHHGGIEIDEIGNYYYYAKTDESLIELILLTINFNGFLSLDTLNIHVNPDSSSNR